MPNIIKLEFSALDILDNNYLSWILDVEIDLAAMNFVKTIKKENVASLHDFPKALTFLRHHIEDLKCNTPNYTLTVL